MIYLLHGDDTAQSRGFINNLTEGYAPTYLDGKNISVATLEENIVSTGLFEEKKAVIVENLLSKNLKKKDFIKFLAEHDPTCLLVLWEDKKLAKTTFSALKNATVKEFLLPSFYFQFLDSFAPSNKKKTFQLYQELLKTYDATQVYYSLLKRVRQLLVISSGARTEEIVKMSPWQLTNLKKQLQLWSKESLLNVYDALQETEIKLKTGKLPVSLSKHLDIIILSELI